VVLVQAEETAVVEAQVAVLVAQRTAVAAVQAAVVAVQAAVVAVQAAACVAAAPWGAVEEVAEAPGGGCAGEAHGSCGKREPAAALDAAWAGWWVVVGKTTSEAAAVGQLLLGHCSGVVAQAALGSGAVALPHVVKVVYHNSKAVEGGGAVALGQLC